MRMRITKKTKFSLIEMMTVIVVILILITLSVPSINQIKKKARTVICANQMKQLGVLISTYTNDNDGKLPYTTNYTKNATGITSSYKDKKVYGPLYGSWAGHLLPYLNFEPTSWDRGLFYYDINTDDVAKPSKAVADENYQNWRLLHDMYMEGGHGSLKLFICPEAAFTYSASHLKFGYNIPRISGILKPYSGRGLYGLPSSYLCNGQLFGKSAPSKRMEDVDKKNFLLVEGCDAGGMYQPGMATPIDYRKVFQIWGFYGGSINHVIGGNKWKPQIPDASPPNVAFQFLHDDTEEIWYSTGGKMGLGTINRYNKIFSPVSSAFFNWDHSESKFASLASKQYPGENWENYENSSTKGKYRIHRYYSTDYQMSYYFGDMNFLAADLSVSKRHISSMFQNAREIGQNYE
ncbi:MAG: hypothetical protein COA79_13985 [Planctomycetota bacterium]|nr:MAG: hypothetical protein COA79_13985 [Planctomycetota bacterium]